ncbi:MAG: PilN domain-containing protein [Gammaproteobacteria bacterium]|nr:PilN domain-containing protein [Gammaproteobacteria bacterium]MDH5654005.1 PilN domain-containing protein [Gammaproteobacteria bacterium]
MAHINLLPWRQERREEQQRQLLTITGLSVVLMLLIILAVHLEISRQISTQNARNAYLQQQINIVNQQLTEISNLEKGKKNLLDRMKIIQRLQENRPEIVHLFDELARRIPEGVHLTSFKQVEKALTIEGIAQSNARVSAFMRNIDTSEWLGNPQLSIIKTDDKKAAGQDGTRSFILQAQQMNKLAQSDNEKEQKKQQANK